MDGATLVEFARVNDSAAATAKKLRKQAILAEYFRTLTDEDLRLAVRFVAGWTSGRKGVRVLNVGWALVSSVVVQMLGLEPGAFHELVVKSGEIGEALAGVWSIRREQKGDTSVAATLRDVAAYFDELAGTGNQERKREILREMYRRCVEPREAAYLSKIIFRQMRTGIQEGVLLQGIAAAFNQSFDEVQRCQLLVGDLGEVAVMAKNGALSCAAFRLFHPIQFMLATAQQDAQEAAETMGGRAFFAEDKFDGIRAQVHKQGDEVVIYTRTMERCEESYPDVMAAVRKLPGDFLLDGEIVPYEHGQVLPFAHVQRRLGRKVLSAKIIKENPLRLIAFDLLYRDGVLWMDRPLRERRGELERLLGRGEMKKSHPHPDPLPSTGEGEEGEGGVLLSRARLVSTAEEIEAAFCVARDCRNEGLVLKDPESVYSPGRRGQAWLKLKTHLPTLDCVVTAAETGHGKRRNSLSDYTFAVWDREPGEEEAKLVNVGKAYSGVTDEEIAQLTDLFMKLTVRQYGRVRLVEPKVVLEIACDQIQKSNRHESGFAFRFPRIKRIRWDKRPEDADRLARVIEVYESTTNFGRGKEKRAEEKVPEPTLFDF